MSRAHAVLRFASPRRICHQVDPREHDGEFAEAEQMARDRDDPRGHGQCEVRRVHDSQPCPEVRAERRAGALAGPGMPAIFYRARILEKMGC